MSEAISIDRSPDRRPGRSERACPVCGDHTADVLRTERFVLPEGHPLGTGYDVVCCRRCGAVFADTSIPQETYDRFYAELSKYVDPATSTGGGEQAWDQQRLREMAAIIADVVPDRFRRIVEIGCANGGLLRALAELGYERLVGVDPASACVHTTASIPGVTAHVGTLFTLPREMAEADCVVLSHVLEHVQDVAGALASIRGAMRPDAVLYVEVPDAMRYREYVVAPFQDFNTEHINHFSLASLGNALAQNGFRVVRDGERDIPASVDVRYPALYVFAQPTSEVQPLRRDVELRAAIEAYVRRSVRIMDAVAAQISGALASDVELIVWGVGQTTFKLLASTPLADARVRAFVDTSSTYRGRRLHDAPIVGPEALREMPPLPILVGSLVNRSSILSSIARLGIENPILEIGPEA